MTSCDSEARVRRHVSVHGVVQGVGFRPHVLALARSLDLAGAVWNTGAGVTVEVEGSAADVDAFCRRVRDDAPPLALDRPASTSRRHELRGGTGFAIRASERGAGRTFVSPDVAICADCRAELDDPADRRHRHPFITCTNCGPRFTITTGLPVRPAGDDDGRVRDVRSLRPRVRRPGRPSIPRPDGLLPRLRSAARPRCAPSGRPTYGDDALAEARRLLLDGGVVAVKGIGGYHLACDAAKRRMR